MKIQPVQSWQNGQSKEATEFDLRIINDNLKNSATFYYSLSSVETSHTETKVVTPEIPAWDEPVVDGEPIHHEAVPEVTEEVKTVDSYSQVLIEGNLGIDGADYQDWELAVNANQYAYTYAAAKLNLVLIPDQKF
jgi:hypothetical protein